MKFPLFILLALGSFYTQAQINTSEKRIEIDLKDGYFNEKIHELDSAGFLITSVKGKPNKTTNIKIPKATVNPERNVLSLFFLIESNISTQRSLLNIK